MSGPATPASELPRSPQLRRSLGLLQATALVAGIMIGAAVFVQASEVSRLIANPWALLCAWLAAALLVLAGTLVCGALERDFPVTGGVYVFLRETISPLAGFLWGWAMFWTMHSGIVAAIAVVAARYSGLTVPLSGAATRGVAMIAILALTALNCFGVNLAARAQVVLTAIKIAAIVGLALAVAFWAHSHVAPPVPAAAAYWPSVTAFLLAVSAGLFAFGGWHMGTYAAGETRAAGQTIPRAMFLATFIVAGCYLALNAAYLRVLPWHEVAGSTRVAAEVASVLVGGGGATLVSLLVVISALGALNGVILAGPRVYLAMAQDRLAPAWLAAVHPRFRTPTRALLLQAVWSCLLVGVGTYRQLFTGVVYLEWIFFGLLAIGMIRHFRRITWAALLFLFGCILIAGNLLLSQPRTAFVVLAFALTGVPVYYWQIRHSHFDHASHR